MVSLKGVVVKQGTPYPEISFTETIMLTLKTIFGRGILITEDEDEEE